MVIEESNLKFKFTDNIKAIKFDDTNFYRELFNCLPGGKGVDILANDDTNIQFIEIKNCKGNESENMWRTSINNSKKESAPRELDVEDRDSLDIEVSKKVASTIACLYGVWSKSLKTEKTLELIEFWKGINDVKIPKDKKKLLVILFLEGDFTNKIKTRSKKMVMKRIQDSISKKLSWLDCKVMVVDSDTYSKKYFKMEV